MQRTLSLLAAGAAALVLAAPAAALDVDLVVQMPLAVAEVEDAGYPRDDLALLASGLVAAELEPVEVIDLLRWAPVVWLLDELEGDAELFLDPAVGFEADLDPGVRRLRLIEDRDGRFLLTTREDLVFVDLADPVVVERQFLVDRDREVVFVDRDLDRLDGMGMGATVQLLLDRGLRGRRLAEAIHAELNRRGIPAGSRDRLDGPPPVSRRFVVAQFPERVIVGGREVFLLDDVEIDDVEVADLRLVPPPVEVRRRLAEARPIDRRPGRLAEIDRRDDERGRGRDDRGGPPEERGRARGRDDRGPDDRGGPPADRGRGAGRDDRGGGPPDRAEERGRGRDDRGGPPAARGERGRGEGPPAARGNSGRAGGPQADRGGRGGGEGKGKGGGGDRGGGQGKGRG